QGSHSPVAERLDVGDDVEVRLDDPELSARNAPWEGFAVVAPPQGTKVYHVEATPGGRLPAPGAAAAPRYRLRVEGRDQPPGLLHRPRKGPRGLLLFEHPLDVVGLPEHQVFNRFPPVFTE